MNIEDRLQQIVDTLKAIHTAIASGAAVSAAAPAPAPAETKADKPKAEKAKAEPKKEEAAAPAPAPAPVAPAAVNWDTDVMPVLKQISSSTKEGHGRTGLTKLIAHFTDGKGKNIPDVQATNKHADVLAYAKALLAGEPLPGAEDDLGLGF